MIEDILTLVENKEFVKLRSTLSEMNGPDIALLLDEVPQDTALRLFRLLPKDSAAELFVLMDADAQERIITSFNDSELSEMLSELYLDDTVDIIEEMPANVVKRILRNSAPEDRSRINELLGYPKDSAGTVMTTEYVRLIATMTVGEALEHLRKVAIDKETIYTCYVTDKSRRLIGIVSAKDLLISPLDKPIEDIMEKSVICALTTDDREQVARTIEKYGFLALPIVDNEKRLVGIVTVDDAINVLFE